MAVLSDELISHLLGMPKVVKNPGARGRVLKKSDRINYQVESLDGQLYFELYTRQNLIDPDAYSCGLVYYPRRSEKGITLTRYNGSNHVHHNPLEGDDRIVNQCHIHRATERYMEVDAKCDKFAETTSRYTTLSGALECLLADCNIGGLEPKIETTQDEPSGQIPLFQ